MKIFILVLAILALSACSFRGWDPPNYGQSLCQPVGCGDSGGARMMPHIPLTQMNGANV